MKSDPYYNSKGKLIRILKFLIFILVILLQHIYSMDGAHQISKQVPPSRHVQIAIRFPLDNVKAPNPVSRRLDYCFKILCMRNIDIAVMNGAKGAVIIVAKNDRLIISSVSGDLGRITLWLSNE